MVKRYNSLTVALYNYVVSLFLSEQVESFFSPLNRAPKDASHSLTYMFHNTCYMINFIGLAYSSRMRISAIVNRGGGSSIFRVPKSTVPAIAYPSVISQEKLHPIFFTPVELLTGKGKSLLLVFPRNRRICSGNITYTTLFYHLTSRKFLTDFKVWKDYLGKTKIKNLTTFCRRAIENFDFVDLLLAWDGECSLEP